MERWITKFDEERKKVDNAFNDDIEISAGIGLGVIGGEIGVRGGVEQFTEAINSSIRLIDPNGDGTQSIGYGAPRDATQKRTVMRLYEQNKQEAKKKK